MDLQLNFIDVLLTVASLVILTLPGFILAKTKIFGKEADKALSGLVLYGCQPMLMFVGFQKTKTSLSGVFCFLWVILKGFEPQGGTSV